MIPENFTALGRSGTALFCYAIAWGVNNGILKRETCSSVVEKAWQWLVGCIDETGGLCRVQPPGDGARTVKDTDSMEYGTGAFLMAGSEMNKFWQRKDQSFLNLL